MVTVAHLTGKLLDKKPFIQEALARGLINYASLADELKPEIERELGKRVKPSAVMMALRRASEKLGKRLSSKARFGEDANITITSDLFEITVPNSYENLKRLGKVHDSLELGKGDLLTITQGISQITIIANRKNKKRIESIFKQTKIIKVIDKLASVTLRLPPNSVEIVGIFYLVTRAFAWEDIPVVEIVSTLDELTCIVREDDTSRSFDTLKKLLRSRKR